MGQQFAYEHCTGPVYVWCGVPSFSGLQSSITIAPWSNGQIYYVGTVEQSVVAETEDAYNGVFTSESGPRVPQDKEYLGTQETLVFDFNRFNANVIDMLEAAPQYGRGFNNLQSRQPGSNNNTQAGTAAGTNTSLDYGTLLIANKGFYQLWLQYSYYDTDIADTFPDMPPGWFYFCCNTAAVYIPKQGLRNKMRRLVVEANNLRNSGTSLPANMAMKTNVPIYFNALNGLTPG